MHARLTVDFLPRESVISAAGGLHIFCALVLLLCLLGWLAVHPLFLAPAARAQAQETLLAQFADAAPVDTPLTEDLEDALDKLKVSL